MTAARVSHSQVSYTSTPGLVYQRATSTPPVLVSLRAAFGLGGLERERSGCVGRSMDVMMIFLLPAQNAPLGGASLLVCRDLLPGQTNARGAGLRYRRFDFEGDLILANLQGNRPKLALRGT